METQTRRADAERRKSRIIAGAATVLADDPAAGMEAIAAASGVSRVTLNRHFVNRDNLVAAVFEHVLKGSAAVFEEARLDEGAAADATARLYEAWLALDLPMLSNAVLAHGAAHLHDDVRNHYFEVLAKPLLALAERGRRTGEFEDMPVEWIAALLGGIFRSGYEAVHDGHLSRAEAAELATRSFLGAVGASREGGQG